MNRKEFMEKLRALLSDMEESEREEALSYYEEYFDDAGAGKEQEVIAALGSPENVAKTIKAGLNDSDGSAGEFSETGFCGYGDEKKEAPGFYQKQKKSSFAERIRGLGTGGIILVLILAIFALPILIPCCIGVIALAFGLLIAAAAIVFSVAIVGVALAAAGAALFVSAFPSMVVSPAMGIVLIGLGFLLIGIGILLAIVGILVVWKLVPPIIRWIVRSIQRLFTRKEKPE